MVWTHMAGIWDRESPLSLCPVRWKIGAMHETNFVWLVLPSHDPRGYKLDWHCQQIKRTPFTMPDDLF